MKYLCFVRYQDVNWTAPLAMHLGELEIKQTRGGFLYCFELESDMLAFLAQQREWTHDA